MNDTIWGLPYYYFLIGHRGVGKSTFLRQLSSCYPQLSCYDLDAEIEQKSGKTVSDFFAQEGEQAFRQREKQVLQDLLSKAPLGSVIALGAGFELDDFSFPPNSLFHWLRRCSDPKGRIFLNRPLLPSLGGEDIGQKDPYLDSYLKRFAMREERYSRWASIEWLLPEGFEWYSKWQWGKRDLRGAIVTLTPWFLGRPERRLWLSIFENFYVEVRSDLLSPDEARKLLESCHASVRRIFSVRPSMRPEWFEDFSFTWDVLDCDEELLPSLVSTSLSSVSLLEPNTTQEPTGLGSSKGSHDEKRENPVSDTFKKWSLHVWKRFLGAKILSSHSQRPPSCIRGASEDVVLKWSPLLSSWSDIKQALTWGHEQWRQGRRAFLAPRFSPNLREHEESSWLREYLLTQQGGHFIRFDGMGSYPGQLAWNRYQHLVLSRSLEGDLLGAQTFQLKRFRAVLGDPVSHSHSPAFHENDSLMQQTLFLKIPVTKGDLKPTSNQDSSFSLSVLEMLPVTQAAVTSPLKKSLVCGGDEAEQVFPVNTWKVPARAALNLNTQEGPVFYNTDLVALLWVWKFWQEQGISYWLLEDVGRWREDWEQGVKKMEAFGLHLPAIFWNGGSQKAYALYQEFVKNFVALFGLQNLQLPVYVYGQGAMGEILQGVFPNAISVGVREGQEKEGARVRGVSDFHHPAASHGLIWAGSPEASYQLWLEKELSWIWDMNYHEWSLARSLALQRNIPYLSGRPLFVIQAWWQQRLWGADEK